MRRIWLAAVALIGLSACGQPATHAVKAVAPQATARKAGLWEQTTVSPAGTQVTRLCVGPGDKAGFALTVADGAKVCAEPKLRPRVGGGFDFTAVCDLGDNGRQSAHAAITGDLTGAYREEVETTVTGAKAQQMNGVRRYTVTAAWKGPCPADMRPGELELPGGVRIDPGAGG
ncbi:DUF3617 domain-containing protein [Phenylobacterium sp.]|uniref:DUF3617 domain-containing protein n=1 Tax=Phenylobacterium sp. TaxID=1871053 RepID=UPI002DEE554D|nr:DUF3617 family protein [Phenylobacterium sp.]